MCHASVGISHHKIYDRYKDSRLDGLNDRSRAPYRQANKLPFQPAEFSGSELAGAESGSAGIQPPLDMRSDALTWDIRGWFCSPAENCSDQLARLER